MNKDSYFFREIKRKLFLLIFFVGVLFIFSVGENISNTKNKIATGSLEVGFTSISPRGVFGGEIIPASCESGDYHDAPDFGRVCLVSNVCGQSNQGTIVCGGGCSVTTAPALPSGYGTPCQSSANSCGQKANGIIGCTGVCTAITPSDLNCTTCPAPKGNGVCDPKENNSNCPADCPYVAPATTSTPAGEGAIWTPASEWALTASPNPIFANTRSTVSYSASGATGCTLVGVGVNTGKETDRYVGGPAVDYPTSKLQENTDFTLTCKNAYSGRSDSKTVRVIVRTINIREF